MAGTMNKWLASRHWENMLLLYRKNLNLPPVCETQDVIDVQLSAVPC